MARGHRTKSSAAEAPRPVVQVLGWLILGCLVVAVFLGLSKRGEPVWHGARAFFLPGGVLMMLQSTLLGGRRAHPIVAVAPNRMLAPGLFVCGLGLAGLGLEELDPGRTWSLFTIPMWVFLGLLFLREAVRGRRSVLIRSATDPWRRFAVRAGAWLFGLGWPIGVLWAVGLAHPD